MNQLRYALEQIQGHLAASGRSWALLGGLAVSARSEPRFTRDVDLAVAVADDEDAEALCRAMQGLGYRILMSVEQDATGRLATVRLGPGASEEGVVVDLLFASSGIENEIVNDSEFLEVQRGLMVPVARAHHLLALKLLSRDDSRRPQDAADIKALMKVMSADELEECKLAVGLIESRGYARRRDLQRALAEAIGQYGKPEPTT